ncbi:aldehyde dehydrogenase family protein [Devosia rhodophyticola]|uniref:Aldehyde dehydrogenase family protein n=1 Tax=Devosia rhodophyticola TaxID=3026423 RepID=A0ABY7YV19_9HYPH|nr:aldehyde dehydrogenase family protein [Devosia rhodophyticola]WDR05211.1 aldehyde dehydrogenase family protein [Devosia rhodophyticola]
MDLRDRSGSNIVHESMYVDGAWLDDRGRQRIEVLNPANEQVIGTIEEGTPDDAVMALEAARRAQPGWAALPAPTRGALVSRLADAVVANAEHLARVVTLEQGKPIGQARGEIGAVVAFLRYAAENARRIEGDIIASDNPNEEIQIRRHPHGVVVGLTAWNYPAALAARKLGPALVTGNTFVLLAHEITPLSGLELARLAHEAGFPPGVFNVVTGRGLVVGKTLVESPLSDLVTMTGSTRAGKQIYGSGAAGLKVLRLELGGKAPFIVMEDADINTAVGAAVAARYTNCGQICTCNERMYLHSDIADEFLEKFIKASKALTIGDPMEDPDMGPKVSGIEVDKIKQMVDRGVAAGAKVLLEGGPMSGGIYDKGHWYAPTVLEVTENSSPLIQEEVFGPVVPALRVDSFEQAIAHANDTEYGLSAYLFTQNMKRLLELPSALKFGEIYFNRSNGEAIQGFHTGWGHSGLGGEDGKYGFDGYLRKQTLYVNWG